VFGCGRREMGKFYWGSIGIMHVIMGENWTNCIVVCLCIKHDWVIMCNLIWDEILDEEISVGLFV